MSRRLLIRLLFCFIFTFFSEFHGEICAPFQAIFCENTVLCHATKCVVCNVHYFSIKLSQRKCTTMKMNENGLFHSLNFIYSRIFSEKKDALTHIESLSTAEKQRRNSRKRNEKNQRERGSGGGRKRERRREAKATLISFLRFESVYNMHTITTKHQAYCLTALTIRKVCR